MGLFQPHHVCGPFYFNCAAGREHLGHLKSIFDLFFSAQIALQHTSIDIDNCLCALPPSVTLCVVFSVMTITAKHKGPVKQTKLNSH